MFNSSTYLPNFQEPLQRVFFHCALKINTNPKISFNEIKLFQYKYI